MRRAARTVKTHPLPPPSPRRAAADVVIAILDERQTLEDALARTPSFDALDGRDRAFARAIVSATLRRLGGIDAVLAAFLARPLPETAYLGRALLRTGAAQILALDTPAHAAVSETVALANADRKAAGFAKLMNAVLRKVANEGKTLFAAQPPGADLPAWLYTRWRAAYGDRAAAIARTLRAEPPTDLSAANDAAGWAAKLGAALLPTGAIRLPADAPPIDKLPGYADGAWWVQDAAAAIPATLLGDVRDLEVLDLCAAPGGKTMQLAAAGARVTALDKDSTRLERLKHNLRRTNLAAETICADVLAWSPEKTFDAVLLDAPCTATGTLRRHPDVAWRRRPGDVRKIAATQSQLLRRAGDLVKPGGRLVYAVCSLEPEEGPAIAAAALASGLWSREALGSADVPEAFVTPDGDLRTTPADWPDLGGVDGFFAARLVRNA